ncbi:MAG: ABC-type sugar transport system substrate-binding protein [Oleispira sp.]|jgi:ABC-type sugar transport system substrate-binding protein
MEAWPIHLIVNTWQSLIIRLPVALLFIFFFILSAEPVNAQQKSEALSGGKTHKVVFINPGHSDKGFWKNVTATMSAAATQLGFELEVYYSDRQWLKMVRNAEAVIHGDNKPDFLIIVNEYQEGARLLALADKAGIQTLMLLNSLTPEQYKTHGAPKETLKNWAASITPDNETAGYEMARSLVTHIITPDKTNQRPIALLTLAGDNNTPASQVRLKGLDRALADFPQLKEQRRISVNWSRKAAYKRTGLWLKSGHPLDAVWAANDAIALGAIKAIREAELKPGIDVKVVGLNWSPEAISHVIEGEMILTHGGHFMAGAWAIVMLYDLVHGYDFDARAEGMTRQIHFPMTAITQANAANYITYFGDQQWSRIPFKEFSLTHSKNPTGYQFTLDKLIQSLHPRHNQHHEHE